MKLVILSFFLFIAVSNIAFAAAPLTENTFAHCKVKKDNNVIFDESILDVYSIKTKHTPFGIRQADQDTDIKFDSGPGSVIELNITGFLGEVRLSQGTRYTGRYYGLPFDNSTFSFWDSDRGLNNLDDTTEQVVLKGTKVSPITKNLVYDMTDEEGNIKISRERLSQYQYGWSVEASISYRKTPVDKFQILAIKCDYSL